MDKREMQQAVDLISEKTVETVWNRFIKKLTEDDDISDVDLCKKYLFRDRRTCILQLTEYNIRRAEAMKTLADVVNAEKKDDKVMQEASMRVNNIIQSIAAWEGRLNAVRALEKENFPEILIKEQYGEAVPEKVTEAPAPTESVRAPKKRRR